ncbi:alkaline phosphatase PhoX [Streptomyces sp. NPDC007346]|uniref:PhoX family protein n=1 Tax=Streptomyces sp. NPDC007346 TaxID=3154682 RepID=UPI003452469A
MREDEMQTAAARCPAAAADEDTETTAVRRPAVDEDTQAAAVRRSAVGDDAQAIAARCPAADEDTETTAVRYPAVGADAQAIAARCPAVDDDRQTTATLRPAAGPSTLLSTLPPTGPSRRGVVAGGALAAAGLLALGTPAAAALAPAAPTPAAGPPPVPAGATRRSLARFTAVAASEADTVTVPAGFRTDVLAPWGGPVHTSGPDWREDASATAAEQARQIGSHHHGVQFLPLGDGPEGNRHGLLVISHEATDPALLGGDARKAMSAQGLTVLEVRESHGTWQAVADSAYNRRITADSPVRFSGPVPVHGRARGVLAPSGQGLTPWGTCLVAEENANAFFGTDDADWQRGEKHVRYGLSAAGHGHPWHEADERFDLASAKARPEQFGWVVEFDPRDPSALPVKRTALGRFAHGGATVTEAAGRLVVYSTDAEDAEYLYKYVSAGDWRETRAKGRSPLDHGTLYVARFDADGTGRWLPLTHGHGPLTRDKGWRDQADVLVRTRLAADALGATPLTRPERVAVNPVDGEAYLALANSPGGGTSCATGGTGRAGAADEAGGTGAVDGAGGTGAAGGTRTTGKAGATGPDDDGAVCGGTDPYGRVIRWREAAADSRGDRQLGFRWEEFLAADDPDRSADGTFAAPKGLWFSADGTLWISTGVSGHELNGPAPLHRAAGNNALLAADPATGEVRRFLTAPRGAEVAGVTGTPDGQTLFVNIQHPGERTARWGAPDAKSPRAVSNWPDHTPTGRPRSATVAVHREAT